MRLRTRLSKLEQAASRPQPDYRAVLMGVAEQVPAADRSLILSTITAWETGDEAQMHRFVREIGDEALELVCQAFDRAGIRATGDNGVMQQLLTDAAGDPELSDEDRGTAQKTLADLKAGRLHPSDVIPSASDELLAALERALHRPQLRVASPDSTAKDATDGP